MEVPEAIQALPGQELWCTITALGRRQGLNTLLLLQLPMVDWHLETPPVPDTRQSYCSVHVHRHAD